MKLESLASATGVFPAVGMTRTLTVFVAGTAAATGSIVTVPTAPAD